MRFKLSSATALLYFLSFLYFDHSSSLDFSAAATKPRIQGRQDGRRLSSDSHERINEVLGVSIPKVSSDTDENMGFNQVDCEPLEEFRNQTRAADGSVWIIDNQALESLDNDPQTLIQCTKPGDRVAFKLSGLHKFKRTLQIFHQLELFAEFSQSKEVGNDTVNTSIFTCPDSGPFLRIKARGFNASGFVVQNCTESQGDGAIEILSESIVMFEDTAFSDNRKRAIFVASNASLSLRSCYFEHNGNRNTVGGAIRIRNDGLLSINNSTFYGNIGKLGGAIYGNYNIDVFIQVSEFSRNKARRHGGAIRLRAKNTLNIINTTLSGNTATLGGAILTFDKNSLNVKNTMLSENSARGNGGAIYLASTNNFNVINTTLSGNSARGNGGAIHLASTNNFNVINTTLSGNSAQYDGGAIRFYDKNTVYVINATLLRNNAQSDGGAIDVRDKNNLTIINAKLLENKASEFGGVIIFADNNIALLVGCDLIQNTAQWHGGAMKLGHQNSMNIKHCLMQGNSANWGGSIYVERNTTTTISNSNFTNNNASRGGVLYAGMSCEISIDQSEVIENRADFGGCLYGVGTATKMKDSKFEDNHSSQSGGCLYVDFANAYVQDTSMTLSEAKKDGGAIYASSGTDLRLVRSEISSNSAVNGGGIALASNSRIVCYRCALEKNTADRGGGVHIESQMMQSIVAQFAQSTIRNNSASRYGGRDNWHSRDEVKTFAVGGMVIKTFGSKNFDCKNIVEPCSRVLLIETSFVGNKATLSGSAILATRLNHILVACGGLGNTYDYSRFLLIEDIQNQQRWGYIQQFSKSPSLCESWKDNQPMGGTRGEVVTTFGQTINITTNPANGQQVTGSSESGFTLHGVRSTRQFPHLIVKTIDAFGHFPAPILFEKDALLLNSSSEILENSIALLFENATCVIKGISSNLPKGNYTIEINPKEEDVLEPTNLTIVISGCGINEELTSEDSPCQECRIGSYNFDGSKINGCSPCPKGANCIGNYTLSIGGYWNKGPCHARVKRCIVEKACEVEDKVEKLGNLTRDFKDCNMTNETLSNYSNAQCHEGYKGPLCGSCEEAYGISSKLECSKCGHVIVIILRFFGVVVYLLIGTIITIKGVLPSNSSHHGREDVETPFLEQDNTTSIDVASSSQVREEVEEANQEPSPSLVEGDINDMDSSSSEEDEIEVTKQKLVSSWKISLNYFQVTSNAAGMDVEWTKKILDMLRGLNILGAATTDSISYSFDCLFSSASNDSKAIWRLVFSLVVPLIVILLLSLHWGYRSFTKRGRKSVYILRRLTLTVITVTYATYFDLTQVAMRTFSCVVVHADVDHFSNAITRYWVGDTSLECYKNTHIVLICISLVVVTFVTIGFPTISSYTLNQHKSEVRDTSTWIHDTLGFLGGPFKQKFIYWECVTMIKKAILSIIIVFSYSLDVQSQGLLILLVLVFFLYTHFLCYPYDEKYHTLNYYESGSLLVSCVTYTLVQFFNVKRFSQVARSIVSFSIIAINVGFVFLVAYKIVRDLTDLLKKLLESQNIYVPKNMNVISLVRVYSKKSRLH